MSAKLVRELMQSATQAHGAGLLDDAEKIYHRLLGVRPGHAPAVHLLGVICCQRKQFDAGLKLITQAISASPGQAEFYNSRGNALRGLNRVEEAIAAYHRAFELDPADLATLNNLGMALDRADRIPEALDCFDRLIAKKDDVAEWHANRGGVQAGAGLLPQAIASQRRAIALRPELAGAHAKLATALLASGEFAEGWREFEWRFRAGVVGDPTRDDPAPVWDGTPIPGKTLLVQAEQGFGDFFQCVRYVPRVAAGGAKVILRCQPALRKLVERVDGVAAVVTTDDAIPPHDLQVPIFSFPKLFGTDLATIPRTTPYLSADQGKAKEYERTNDRKRIGLAWAGSTAHGNDRRRSCPAERFNSLAGIEGVDFYRLQMPRDLPAPSALHLVDRTDQLQDFDDTAALISQLDLVISVDTSVVHLTGALGKPVWVLLPFAAEWRWMANREDSPWYPTARLFRQLTPGDWAGVMERVRDAVRVRTVRG